MKKDEGNFMKLIKAELKEFGGVFFLSIVMVWLFIQQASFTVSVSGLILVIGHGYIIPMFFFGVFFRLVRESKKIPIPEFLFIAIALIAGAPISIFGAFYYNSGVINGTFSGIEEAFYFSVTTFTSLGLGNISPGTTMERIAASFEAMLGYIFLGAILALFIKSFKP